MAANTNPIFTLTPNVGCGAPATADNVYTSPAHAVDVFTAGANGSLVTRLSVHGQGTVAACIIKVWLYDGANTTLYEEIAVAAASPSSTVVSPDALSAKITPQTPLALNTGWKIKASVSVSQAMNVIAEGGDY